MRSQLLMLLLLFVATSARDEVQVSDASLATHHKLNFSRDAHLPSHAEAGATIVLSCPYTGDNETVVKWYKDEQEFYQLVGDPMDKPDVRKQNLPVGYSPQKSTHEKIVLENVSVETNGKYKCELTHYNKNIGNGIFTTDLLETTLTVVSLPRGPPSIEVLHRRDLDDNITVNCCAPQSDPITHLHWFRNGETVSPSLTTPNETGQCLSMSVPHLDTSATFTCVMRMSVAVEARRGSGEKLNYVEDVYWSRESVTLPTSSSTNRRGKGQANMLLMFASLLSHYVLYSSLVVYFM